MVLFSLASLQVSSRTLLSWKAKQIICWTSLMIFALQSLRNRLTAEFMHAITSGHSSTHERSMQQWKALEWT